MIDKKELQAGFSKGLGLAFGFFIVAGLLLSVYAFVEPGSGPSVDYYFDSRSPLASNYTLEFLGHTGTFTNGNLGGIDGAIDACDSIFPGSRPATYLDIVRLGSVYNYTYNIWLNADEYDADKTTHHCFYWTSSSGSRTSVDLDTSGNLGTTVCNDATMRFACVRGN